MANAGMKTIGAKAIAAALCANHTLETIDLSGNNFGCKEDDNSWESASELLSFGLKASCVVCVVSLASFRKLSSPPKAGENASAKLLMFAGVG